MKEKQNFGLKFFLFFLLKIHLKYKFCFIVVRNLRELFFKYLLFAKSFPSIHKLFFKFLPNFLRYTRYRYLLQSLIYRSILSKFLIKWPKTTIITKEFHAFQYISEFQYKLWHIKSKEKCRVFCETKMTRKFRISLKTVLKCFRKHIWFSE